MLPVRQTIHVTLQMTFLTRNVPQLFFDIQGGLNMTIQIRSCAYYLSSYAVEFLMCIRQSSLTTYSGHVIYEMLIASLSSSCILANSTISSKVSSFSKKKSLHFGEVISLTVKYCRLSFTVKAGRYVCWPTRHSLTCQSLSQTPLFSPTSKT